MCPPTPGSQTGGLTCVTLGPFYLKHHLSASERGLVKWAAGHPRAECYLLLTTIFPNDKGNRPTEGGIENQMPDLKKKRRS